MAGKKLRRIQQERQEVFSYEKEVRGSVVDVYGKLLSEAELTVAVPESVGEGIENVIPKRAGLVRTSAP